MMERNTVPMALSETQAVSWEQLAATLGPQSAAYRYDESWDGQLRSAACRCGAPIEVPADEATDGYELCDRCSRIRLAAIEDGGG